MLLVLQSSQIGGRRLGMGFFQIGKPTPNQTTTYLFVSTAHAMPKPIGLPQRLYNTARDAPNHVSVQRARGNTPCHGSDANCEQTIVHEELVSQFTEPKSVLRDAINMLLSKV